MVQITVFKLFKAGSEINVDEKDNANESMNQNSESIQTDKLNRSMKLVELLNPNTGFATGI